MSLKRFFRQCFDAKVLFVFIIPISWFIAASNLHAQSHLAGVAVTPDQATVYCGGANRVLYSLDPETLEVRDRTFLGFEVDAMFVSSDGSALTIASHDEHWLTILSTKDFSQIARVENVLDYAMAMKADVVFVAHEPKYVDGEQQSTCQLIDLKTGESTAEAKFDVPIHTVGSACDASQFVIMTKGESDDSESKFERSMEKQTQLTKKTRRQKHDQRTCHIIWLDNELNETKRNKSWYTNQSTCQIAVGENSFRAISPYNFNAKFNQTKKIEAFEFSVWMSGMGLTADQSRIAGGTGTSGIIKDFDDPKYATFNLPIHEKIDSEQIAGATFAPDGSVFCTTSGFRIAKIDSQGQVLLIKEVF